MGLARVRRTRIDQLVDEGNKPAKLVQVHLEDPDRFISACQLGITLATLAWVLPVKQVLLTNWLPFLSTGARLQRGRQKFCTLRDCSVLAFRL